MEGRNALAETGAQSIGQPFGRLPKGLPHSGAMGKQAIGRRLLQKP